MLEGLRPVRTPQDREQRRIQIEREFGSAIEAGEIQAYYQPRIRASDGSCAGMEALARWRSPKLGAVSPSEFVPLAEANGLINALGRSVLGTACQDTTDFQRAGALDLVVSVNASLLEFETPGYPDQVANALIESGLTPQHLELEITERLGIEGLTVAEAAIHQLRTMGVRFALDDFGSGFSALSCLVELPLDVLKLDRSLIRNIEANPDVVRLVRGTCALAHELGLEVVAEGVDSLEQIELLRDAGCDELQGFAIGEPMPAHAFSSFLQRVPDKPEEE